jgi:hypothetical protein
LVTLCSVAIQKEVGFAGLLQRHQMGGHPIGAEGAAKGRRKGFASFLDAIAVKKGENGAAPGDTAAAVGKSQDVNHCQACMFCA